MTKRSIQSLGAQEVDVTVIPADLFRQDLSNPADPILDFQDRAIRARRLVSTVPTGTTPLILTSTTKVNNLNADMLDGFHASITDTPNTLVTRDNNGGTTLRALQLKRPDGTTYLDATGGLVKFLDTYGFNFGTAGYKAVRTYTQADAKPAMILLAPVYAGTLIAKNGFIGTMYKSRGSTGAFNISEKYDVICTTAYNTAKLVCTGSNPGVRIVQTTYNNTGYYALYFPSTAENRITLDGLFWGDPIEISDATGYPVTEVSYNLGPYSIVETGSNSNGNWIKFSDGTMICYKRIVETRSVTNPEKDVNFGTTSGYLYTYNDSSPVRLFPQQFIDGSVPIVVSQNDKPPMMWVISNSRISGMITNTGFGVQFIHFTTNNTVFEGMFIAIGRWKQ